MNLLTTSVTLWHLLLQLLLYLSCHTLAHHFFFVYSPPQYALINKKPKMDKKENISIFKKRINPVLLKLGYYNPHHNRHYMFYCDFKKLNSSKELACLTK